LSGAEPVVRPLDGKHKKHLTLRKNVAITHVTIGGVMQSTGALQ